MTPESEASKRLQPLVDTLCQEISTDAGGGIEIDRFANALMRELLTGQWSEEEHEAAADANESSNPEAIDRLMSARIKRAVRQASQVTSGDQRERAERLADRVVVARGDGVESDADGGTVEQRTFEGTFAQSLDLTLKVTDEPDDAVVLTNAGGRAEVEAMDDGAGAPFPKSQLFDATHALAALEEKVLEGAPDQSRKNLERIARGRDLVGEKLNGKYLIERRIGKGGFGTVYQATDMGFAQQLGEAGGARVAIKVLNPNIQRSERAVRSFREEANRLVELDHPNIVRWMTFDETRDGLHFFVMEFLEGRELAEELKENTIVEPYRLGAILVEVLAALQSAHELPGNKALLHLDLKPQNVFLVGNHVTGTESAKVIDFGIGQNVGNDLADVTFVPGVDELVGQDVMEGTLFPTGAGGTVEIEGSGSGQSDGSGSKGGSSSGSSRTNTPSTRTVRRAKGGTVFYASPEQCKHLRQDADIENLDARSDIYSLGVMAFKALTGEYPFERKPQSIGEAYEQHLTEPPRKVRDVRPSVPRRIAKFVDRCLEKDREERWQSAAEAREALERAMQPLVPKSVLVGAPLALVPFLGFATWYFGVRNPTVDRIDDVQLFTVDPNAGGVAPTGERLGSLELPVRIAAEEDDSFRFYVVSPPGMTGEPRLIRGDDNKLRGAEVAQKFELVADDDWDPGDGRRRARIVATGGYSGENAEKYHVRWAGAEAKSDGFELQADSRRRYTATAEVDLGEGDPPALIQGTMAIVAGRSSPKLSLQLQDDATRIRDLALVVDPNAERDWRRITRNGDVVKMSAELQPLVSRTSESAFRDVDLRVAYRERSGRTGVLDSSWPLRFVYDPPTFSTQGLRIERVTRANQASSGPVDVGATAAKVPIVVHCNRDVSSIIVRSSLDVADSDFGRVKATYDLGAGPVDCSVDATGLFFTLTPESVLGAGRTSFDSDEQVTVDVDVVFESMLGAADDRRTTAELEFDIRSADGISLTVVNGEREVDVNEDGTRVDLRDGPIRIVVSEADEKIEYGLFDLTTDRAGRDVTPDWEAGPSGKWSGPLPALADGTYDFELRRYERSAGVVEAGSNGAIAPSRDPLETLRFTLDVQSKLGAPTVAFDARETYRDSITYAELGDLTVSIAGGERKIGGVEFDFRRNDTTIGIARMEPAASAEPISDGSRTLRFKPAKWTGVLVNENERLTDGTYEIEFTVIDVAGLETEPVIKRFDVAVEPPSVQIVSRDAVDGSQVVFVCTATDGNGFDDGAIEVRATCDVKDGPKDAALELVGEVERLNGGETIVATYALPWIKNWSFQQIDVVASGADRFGASSTSRPLDLTLGRFQRDLESPIEPGVAEGAGTALRGSSMILVRGPIEDRPYKFLEGGLPLSSDHEDRLRTTGAPYFVDSMDEYENFLRDVQVMEWRNDVLVPPLRIEDFYLDQHEVTRAEFLEFVDDDDEGYGESRHWQAFVDAGAEPWRDNARIDQWRAFLRSVTGELDHPVYGVTWAEASAYAAWAGKRLPTWLEWEYAVRTEEMNVFAAESPDGTTGQYAHLLEGNRCRPATSGDYLSPLGIDHLTGNVAEWTATPYWTGPRRIDTSTLDKCLEYLLGDYDYRDISRNTKLRFVVVGGGWLPESPVVAGWGLEMAPHDYRSIWFCDPNQRIELRPLIEADPRTFVVGFRCALTPKEQD